MSSFILQPKRIDHLNHDLRTGSNISNTKPLEYKFLTAILLSRPLYLRLVLGTGDKTCTDFGGPARAINPVCVCVCMSGQ